jgi:cytochrome b561
MICPLGTKYEFPKEELKDLITDIKMHNVPEILSTNDETVDKTATIVVLFLLFTTLLTVILIAILLVGCKEKSLFVFREFDTLPITGGKRK